MVANMDFTAFATGLLREQTYFCIIFALSKFDVNLFFRPVLIQAVLFSWLQLNTDKRIENFPSMLDSNAKALTKR